MWHRRQRSPCALVKDGEWVGSVASRRRQDHGRGFGHTSQNDFNVLRDDVQPAARMSVSHDRVAPWQPRMRTASTSYLDFSQHPFLLGAVIQVLVVFWHTSDLSVTARLRPLSSAGDSGCSSHTSYFFSSRMFNMWLDESSFVESPNLPFPTKTSLAGAEPSAGVDFPPCRFRPRLCFSYLFSVSVSPNPLQCRWHLMAKAVTSRHSVISWHFNSIVRLSKGLTGR